MSEPTSSTISDIRANLLDRLKRLDPSVFDEVIFQFFIDDLSTLSHFDAGSQAQKAMRLVRHAEDKIDILVNLQEILDQLDYFKKLPPDGCILVSEGLRKREEEHEKRAMEDARQRGDDPEACRITPEQFYTFRREASWLGIFRGWDAPTSWQPDLMKSVSNAYRSRPGRIATAIVGRGGSGKSVSLRRLAVDLSIQGHRVWWVEDPERLLQLGISGVATTYSGQQFIFLDDVHLLSDTEAERLRQGIQKHPSVVLVVAGRKLPRPFKHDVHHDNSVFRPIEENDKVAILSKIAEVMPDWAETANDLMAESLRGTRLIRLLLVLAREQSAPQNADELEKLFLEMISFDIEQIRLEFPGIADAVIDAAAIAEAGCCISRETLLAFADYYQPEGQLKDHLAQVHNNPRWKIISHLLTYNPKYDVFIFHHDELYEGIISAGIKDLLEPRRHVGDDLWRKTTLALILKRGDAPCASKAFYGFIRRKPHLMTKEHILERVQELLNKGNKHHAYLFLLLHANQSIHQDDQLHLLAKAASVAPFSHELWREVAIWIRKTWKSREERAKILTHLYEHGCQGAPVLVMLMKELPPAKARELAFTLLSKQDAHADILCHCMILLRDEAKPRAKELLQDAKTPPDVLCRCIDLLGKEATERAKELLQDAKTSPDVLCRCIALLGKEATERAKELLQDAKTSPDVLCRCIDLLGKEATERAKELLQISTHQDVLCRCIALLGKEATERAKELLQDAKTPPEVLCRCIALLGKEAKPFATRVLSTWNKHDDLALIVSCLGVAGTTTEAQAASQVILTSWRSPAWLRAAALENAPDSDLRNSKIRTILTNWRGQFRPLLTIALALSQENPKQVQDICTNILIRWHKEITHQLNNRQKRYDGHILKALSHPNLRIRSTEIATRMLKYEVHNPGFLTEALLCCAEKIVKGQFPSWDNDTDQNS